MHKIRPYSYTETKYACEPTSCILHTEDRRVHRGMIRLFSHSRNTMDSFVLMIVAYRVTESGTEFHSHLWATSSSIIMVTKLLTKALLGIPRDLFKLLLLGCLLVTAYVGTRYKFS
jgi:hypothetical protein